MIIVIGDTIVDHYTFMHTERKCREAPGPVTRGEVGGERSVWGGCGNVVEHLRRLGHKVAVFTWMSQGWNRACDDEDTKIAMKILPDDVEMNIMVSKGVTKTHSKHRYVVDGVQQFRLDKGDSCLSLADAREVEQWVLEKLRYYTEVRGVEIDGIILSDYGLGMITKDLPQVIVTWRGKYEATLARKGGVSLPSVPIMVDPRSTNFSEYIGCDVITPNLDEFVRGAGGIQVDFVRAYDTYVPQNVGPIVRAMHTAEFVLLTRGAEGMQMWRGEDSVAWVRASVQDQSKVVDVTGAGDTVIAYLMHEWLGLGIADRGLHIGDSISRIRTAMLRAEEAAGKTICMHTAMRLRWLQRTTGDVYEMTADGAVKELPPF